MKTYVVPIGALPDRLDKVVSRAFGLGLRASRAAIASGRVLVDGRGLPKAAVPLSGQEITLAAEDVAAVVCSATVMVCSGIYAALSKPGGIHSVAGRGGDSVEAMLPQLGLPGWLLMNRLDCLTSGLVLACRDLAGLEQYKKWQDAGLVRKWYLALAHGRVGSMVLRNRILDDRRRTVRVVDEQDEPVRRTEVRPVATVQGNTLVLVRIFMGRRHQIRAHLASVGHALVGDPVYGLGEEGGLRLHHWQVDMPGFSASVEPDWLELDQTLLDDAAAVRTEMAAGSN